MIAPKKWFTAPMYACLFLLRLRTIETSILTETSTALVLVGDRVVFNCSSESKATWWYTPVGSNKSIEFYVLEEGLHPYEFYDRAGFRVDGTAPGHLTLTVANVTARHAGKYECYEDSAKILKTSAELSVIEPRPDCYLITVDLNSSETGITCKLAVSGNVKPKLMCQKLYNRSLAVEYDRNISRTRYYLSTEALPSVAFFNCSVFLTDQSEPMLDVCLYRDTESTESDESETSVASIVAFTVASVVVVLILYMFIYKCYSDGAANSGRRAALNNVIYRAPKLLPV